MCLTWPRIRLMQRLIWIAQKMFLAMRFALVRKQHLLVDSHANLYRIRQGSHVQIQPRPRCIVAMRMWFPTKAARMHCCGYCGTGARTDPVVIVANAVVVATTAVKIALHGIPLRSDVAVNAVPDVEKRL